MIAVLQILVVLLFILIVILFVFQTRRSIEESLPANYQELLQEYVAFYAKMDEAGKKDFEERLRKFISSTRITGANAAIEDLDLVLIGAAAIIPVYFIPDWEYVNLREVLVYPGNFNTDYEQHGTERMISGMVGTGSLEDVMILSKWEVRQGFLHSHGNRNTAVHEFVHLIDKMDGTLDGVPEILLPRKFVAQWQQMAQAEMEKIRHGQSDIDLYGATSPVEFFAVAAEYFFMQPEAFQAVHPVLHQMLQRIFNQKTKTS